MEILSRYNQFLKASFKNVFFFVDIFSIYSGIKRKNLAIFFAILHTKIIFVTYYNVLLTTPKENNFYIYWYNFLLMIATSNLLLRGCILTKLERHLFNDKTYIGPHNYLVRPYLNYFGINDYTIIKNMQLILMAKIFLLTLYYGRLQIIN